MPDAGAPPAGPAAGDRAAANRTLRAAMFTLPLNRFLGTLVRHRVPDLLAAGPREASAVAREAGLHPLSTVRALRVLAAHGVFREVEPGLFENTAASDFLRERPDGLRNMVLYYSSDHYWRQFGAAEHSLRTGESAFEHEFGTSFWDYLRSRPDEQAVFNAMLGELRGHEHAALAAAYDWPAAGTVVDVGGGNGSLLATVLLESRGLRGILLDQAGVLPDADANLAARGVRERCELVACDFFESLPATGELWLLSQILHDWDDERCRVILGRCRERLRPGDRLLVAEMVTVPTEPEPSCGYSDANMLTLFGEARQRTADEYRELFEASGLTLERVVATESPFSLVEARPDPDAAPAGS